MKRFLPLIIFPFILVACNFGDLDNPYDPLSDSYTGVFNISAEKIVTGSEHIAFLNNSTVYTAAGSSSVSEYVLGHDTGGTGAVEGLPGNITDIAAGYNFTLALTDTGEVWAWGSNYYGQLGTGDRDDSMPVRVSAITEPIAQVCAGGNKAVALAENGNVYGWGAHYESGIDPPLPDAFMSTSSADSEIDLSPTGNNLIYRSGGDVYTRGFSSSETTWISDISNIAKVTAGNYHYLALADDGTCYAWGDNNYGQLGDGTTEWTESVHTVTGVGTVTDIACGEYSSYILNAAGDVYAWGSNEEGLLGKPYWLQCSHVPAVPDSLSGTEVTGIFAGADFAGFKTSSEGFIGFGEPWYRYEESSDMATSFRDLDRFRVTGITGQVTGVSVGEGYYIALTDPGDVYTWGDNTNGRLGDGTTTFRPEPVLLAGINDVVSVSASESHSAAVRFDGTVWCWGYNGNGQLGDGTSTDSLSPVQVTGFTGAIQVAAGGSFTAVLKDDGTVWCWGDNTYGQLGDGTNSSSDVPVQVPGLSDITEIAAGSLHVLALGSGGTVWAWGENDSGQLGDGTVSDSNTPVEAGTGYFSGSITSISAGGDDSCGVSSTDGSAWVWGGYKDQPEEFQLDTENITRAAAGDAVLILSDTGSVYGYGYFRTEILLKPSDDYSNPFHLSPFAGLQIAGIAANTRGCAVIDSSGSLYCWGD